MLQQEWNKETDEDVKKSVSIERNKAATKKSPNGLTISRTYGPNVSQHHSKFSNLTYTNNSSTTPWGHQILVQSFTSLFDNVVHWYKNLLREDIQQSCCSDNDEQNKKHERDAISELVMEAAAW